jgi:arabinose-5-phosphate isomerase
LAWTVILTVSHPIWATTISNLMPTPTWVMIPASPMPPGKPIPPFVDKRDRQIPTHRSASKVPGVRNSIDLARQLLTDQAEALTQLSGMIGDPFDRAVKLILTASDQTIVTGIGKSGLIARKIAATLASTGTSAMFMHPVEGVHGDLGAVGPQSVLIALSKSGQTEELTRFVGHFRRVGGHVISICEPGPSPLVELSEVVLPLPVRPEAGPLALAPTTSTLMMLAMGDALAMALLEARGFDETSFARYHPEGSLGRKLLTRASDLMHADDSMALVQVDAGFKDLIIEMTGKRLGMACIVDTNRQLVGVFTDGDLRRLFIRHPSPGHLTAAEAWRASRRDPTETPVKCSTIPPTMLAVESLRIMRESEITVLVVSQDTHVPIGVVRMQDLVKAGIG